MMYHLSLRKNRQLSIVNRQFQRGFTLVEMVLYMGLLSLLLVVMVDLFAASLDVQLESQAVSSVDRDGRFILSRFTYDINRADSIVSPTLGLQANTLQLLIGGVSYTYTLNNGNIQLTNSFGTDLLNSFDSTISNMSFQRLGNTTGKHSIRFLFTITSKTTRPAGPETKQFQTTIGVR